MAFGKRFIPNQHQQEFGFFATGDGATGNMDETATFVGGFKLTEIRCGFSGVCSADIYLRCYISSIEGTVYNFMFLSYALSNSVYYRWVASTDGLLCQSGDTLQFSHITDNTWAIAINGWCTVGHTP